MGKVYEYRTRVTIGDTNLLQNMYFLNFFKIQGIARELWVNERVENGAESLRNGLVLITRSAQMRFIKDFFLYERILVHVQVRNIREVRAELVFKFYNESTMELHAEGYQEIVFANSDHKICRMPENFKKAAIEYLVGG